MHPDPLQPALAQLLLQHPFLASIALRLKRILDSTAATAWTDGVHLAVNPYWFQSLPARFHTSLVGHECLHVVLGHPLRRGNRSPKRWNAACDFAVNHLLQQEGFPLIPGALYNSAFGDASAEDIYQRLPPDGARPAAASRALSAPSLNRPASPGNAAVSPASQAATAPAANPYGEVRDAPSPRPITPAEQAARLKQHAILVIALAQQARAMGNDSAGVRRAAALAAQPATIDWRAVLAEFLLARARHDFSWSAPNPRYIQLGLFLPRLESRTPAHIAFVVDTSGSVPASALAAVTAELEHYLRLFPHLALDVLFADAQVTATATYTAADLPLHLHPLGGGGTNFAPALAALEQADPPPAAIVYLTDLAGSFPDAAPFTPVLWLVFGQPHTPPRAPFGRVVLLPY